MAEKNPTYNFWKISPALFSIICFFLAIHLVISSGGHHFDLLIKLPLFGVLLGMVMAYPLKLAYQKVVGHYEKPVQLKNVQASSQKEKTEEAGKFIGLKMEEKPRFLMLELDYISFQHVLEMMDGNTPIRSVHLNFYSENTQNKVFKREISLSKNIHQLQKTSLSSLLNQMHRLDIQLEGTIIQLGKLSIDTVFIITRNNDDGASVLESFMTRLFKSYQLFLQSGLDMEDVLNQSFDAFLLISGNETIPFEKKKDMVKYVEKTFIGSSHS